MIIPSIILNSNFIIWKVIFAFLDEYNRFECLVRKIFESSLSSLSEETMNKLYFYYGGKIGTCIEYETNIIRLLEIKYKEKESFRQFTISQIIKISKAEKEIDAFNFEVQSIRSPAIRISFYDCATRLINMRNKLAHEVMDLNFRDQDLIDLLSKDQLEQEDFSILQNYTLQKMDDMTTYIASNLVYIRRITTKLSIAFEGDLAS